MYFLLKMVIFQPAMLVYQRVQENTETLTTSLDLMGLKGLICDSISHRWGGASSREVHRPSCEPSFLGRLQLR